MRRILILTLFVVILTAAAVSPYVAYVEKYAPVAVNEMKRSGVPASITLAQGLLESRAGQSALASKGNNHFGVKCHKDWKGREFRQDAEIKNECFRAYASADESFHDHSDFLRYQDRYKFLFELDPTDYKGWAHGLKKAGYATDPAYPQKLIKIIEEYKLYEYDLDEVGNDAETAPAEKDKVPETVKEKKPSKDRKHHVPVPAQTPLALEKPRQLDRKYAEEHHYVISRTMLSGNGVPFIKSVEGETYSSIARSHNLFLKELLAYNDLDKEIALEKGTVVYLQPKKQRTEKGLDKYIVGSDAETLRDIAQRFAVKVKSLQKMNSLSADYRPSEGDSIKLR